ncbi:MAG: MOSC domain-containing protein [Rubrobacter sp.]|nr:MOSC domain-containing protein [Rubrobacter sp.]
MARITSLNVGGPKPLAHNGKYVESGFVKMPVFRPVWLSETNLEGDQQADLRVHGGIEKAVCVYPIEHYPYWEERLGRELGVAAFGENFSTQGLTESSVCIGDTFWVGDPNRGPLVQVSQPRQPCYKLGARYDLAELVLWVQDSGATGFYLRVIEEGEVQPGDTLKLIERPHPDASVAEANRIMHRDKRDAEGLKRLARVEELAPSWREKFEKRLRGEVEDAAPRIEGPSMENR